MMRPAQTAAARRRMLRLYPALVALGAVLYLPNAEVINSGSAAGLFVWAIALAGAAADADKTA